MRQHIDGRDLPGRQITLSQLLGEGAAPTVRLTRRLEPSPSSPARVVLGASCAALIALGIGVSVSVGPTSDGKVSPASVSTAAPAPVRPLKPNPRPYARPGWADPSGDHLSYVPEGGGPGWFSAPAVEAAPDAPLLTSVNDR